MRLTVERVEEMIKYGYYGQISLMHGVDGLVFVYDDEKKAEGEEVEEHGSEFINKLENGEDIAIKCMEVAETRKAVKVEAVNTSAVSAGTFRQQENGQQKTVLEVIEKSIMVGKTPAIDGLCMTEFTAISDLVSPRRDEHYYDSKSSHQLYPSIVNEVEENGILSDQRNFGYELEECLENAVVDNKESLLVGDTGLTDMQSSSSQQWLFGDRLSLDDNDMDDKIIVGHELKATALPFAFQSVDYVAFKKLRGWGIFGRFKAYFNAQTKHCRRDDPRRTFTMIVRSSTISSVESKALIS